MRGAGRRFRGLKVVIVLCGALAAGCGGGGGGGGNDAGGPAAAGPGPDYGTPAAVDDSSQIELKNAASGLVLGITGQSQAAGASLAPEGDSGSADALWHFIPMGKGQYNIESLLSHQVMGVADASTAAGAQVLQWPDSGTADHLWQPYLLSDGNYLIRNVNSGLYLQADSSGVAQSARTASQACSCQEWAACTQLADHPSGSGIEGAYIYPQGGYYYLFASIDACCQGDDSTYRVIVGRSASVTGPYSDRGGVALTDGGGTILLSAHGNVNGPGGESVLVDSVNGAPTPTLVYHYYDGGPGGCGVFRDGDRDYIVYHAYDAWHHGIPTLRIAPLAWSADGWPTARMA